MTSVSKPAPGRERGPRHWSRQLRDDSMQTCIGVASSALVAVTIGMAAPGLAEAAGTTVNPVQTTTYTLTSGANPTTFGPNTSINTSSGDAVDGDTSAQWDVTNQGSLKGAASGVVLQSTSTLTNSGAITGVTGDGVDLVAGGAVTNQTKGTISGAVYGVRLSGPGTVTNAGTITGGTGSVKFEGAGANLLDLQTGSTLVGDAFASTAVGATNTLKLEGKGVANNSFVNFNTLDVEADSIWALNGVSAIGATAVNKGDLEVGDAAHPGATLTSTVTVGLSGTLSGHGTVVGNVTNGGTVAPGGGIGVMTINGNYTQTSKGTLAIEVAAAPTSQTPPTSELVVTGDASLAGTLKLVTDPGVYRKGQRFTFLTAGSITGSFSTLTATNGLPFTVSSTGTTATATLQLGNFALSGGTRNQNGVASAFNNIAIGTGDFDAVANALLALTPGAAQNAAANQLAAEVYPDLGDVARRNTRQFLGDMTAELDERSAVAGKEAPDGGQLFGHGYGHFENLGGDGNAHGFTGSGGGLVVGGDYAWGSTTLGGALGYDSSRISLKRLPQSGHLDTYGGAVFGEQRFGIWFVNGAVSYAGDNGGGSRAINFSGLSRRASAGISGSNLGAEATVGARLNNEGWRFEPMVSYVYTDVRLDGASEHGAGSADLDIGRLDQSASQIQAGFFVARTYGDPAAGATEVNLRLAWAHDLDRVTPHVMERFPVAPGSDFLVAGVNSGGDSALLDAGVNYHLASNVTLYGRYDGAFGDVEFDHRVDLGVRWRW